MRATPNLFKGLKPKIIPTVINLTAAQFSDIDSLHVGLRSLTKGAASKKHGHPKSPPEPKQKYLKSDAEKYKLFSLIKIKPEIEISSESVPSDSGTSEQMNAPPLIPSPQELLQKILLKWTEG